MAERVGFEPTVELPLHTLSKRAHSTALTSLRKVPWDGRISRNERPRGQFTTRGWGRRHRQVATGDPLDWVWARG
jgi:hypothetical protein